MRHIDIFDATTRAQNEGKSCEHCGSRFGHYGHCGLLNRNVGEAERTISEGLSDADAMALHELGVCW